MKENLQINIFDLQLKLLTFVLIVMHGCCVPQADLSTYKNAEALAKEKFGGNYNLIRNESGSYILCSKIEIRKSQPHTELHYFVYDEQNNEIVIEANLLDAEIKWHDEFNLEITVNPEIISEDDDITTFLLNVITKEKQRLDFKN